MRLNALLVDQPAERFGITVSAVSNETLGVDAKFFFNTINHIERSSHLCLADWRCSLNIDDD